MERLTVEVPSEALSIKSCCCPQGHSLIDQEHLMDGEPSIRLLIQNGGESGVIHLHPRYGNFEVECSFELKDGEVYDLLCPTCTKSVRGEEERCIFCGAPMFVLTLPRSGQVQGCTRRGCHNHKLKVIDLNAQLAELFELDTRPRF